MWLFESDLPLLAVLWPGYLTHCLSFFTLAQSLRLGCMACYGSMWPSFDLTVIKNQMQALKSWDCILVARWTYRWFSSKINQKDFKFLAEIPKCWRICLRNHIVPRFCVKHWRFQTLPCDWVSGLVLPSAGCLLWQTLFAHG